MAKPDERLTELLRIKLSPPLGMEGMRGGWLFHSDTVNERPV